MIELLHTDCMTYMATLPDAAFDLAIVDPPYGRGEDGGTNRCHGVKQKNGAVLQCLDGGYAKKDWDREPPPPEYFEQLRRVARHQIVWGANYMPVKLQGGAIVWDKVNDGADQSGAEIAYCSLNERVDVVRYMWRGMMQGDGVGSMRQQGNKALNERRIHPTQKPVKLYEWLLQQYAQPGMKILDTHLGGGSIAIAAHYFGVDLVGCEIDADYWRAAKERFEAETRQLALLAPNAPHEGPAACGRPREGQDMTHRWNWRKWLPERHGQLCRVLATGRMNSALVEFEDGTKVVTSRYAVRKLTHKAEVTGA